MTKTERERVEALLWTHMHRDYRSEADGVRSVLALDGKTGATVLVPIASLSDVDLVRLAGVR
jgi:hypothetical protein